MLGDEEEMGRKEVRKGNFPTGQRVQILRQVVTESSVHWTIHCPLESWRKIVTYFPTYCIFFPEYTLWNIENSISFFFFLINMPQSRLHIFKCYIEKGFHARVKGEPCRQTGSWAL